MSFSRGVKERLVPEEGLSRGPCALLHLCLRLCPTSVAESVCLPTHVLAVRRSMAT